MNYVYVKLARPEGYEDVASELVIEDFIACGDKAVFQPEDVTSAHADLIERLAGKEREISQAWDAIGGRDKHWIAHADEDGVLKRSRLTLPGALMFVMDRLAGKEREIAKLKEHAEAANELLGKAMPYLDPKDALVLDIHNARCDYRRDFQKEEK